jgi:hypothetical protein
MRHLRPFHLFLLLPLIAALAAAPGCNDEPVKGKRAAQRSGGGDEEDAVRVELVPTAWGTISGKVLYDGDPPERKLIAMGANETACHSGASADENLEQTWIVDPATKGVKNAVIILNPPTGKFFKIPEEQLKPQKDEVLHQPHCAFQPHVFVLFPKYYDKETNDLKPTGQKLVIVNDAVFAHNYNMIPGSDANTPKGGTLNPGDKSDLDKLVPDAKPLTFQCNIHNWMRAYGFVLEHPYAAVTGADGTFTIKNAPLGVPLQVVAWHEGVGYLKGGEDGTAETLKGDQVLPTFMVRAKGR